MASPQQLAPTRWRLRTDAPPDPVTGSRRQVSRIFHGSKREAIRAQAAFETAIRGTLDSDTAITVDILLDRWLEHAAADLESRTLAAHRSRVDRYIRPVIGELPLRDLKPVHLDSLYRTPPLNALKPSSIRRVHSTIAAALNQAVRWEWIARSPTDLARPPVMHRTPPFVPDPETVERFLAYLKAHHWDLYVFAETVATLGARPGEVCALTWTNVDLDRGLVTVEASIERGMARRRKPTKTHNVRRVAIDPFLVRLLEKHRASSGMVGCEGAYVFSHLPDHSIPWRPDSAAALLLRAREKSGCQAVTMRSLRHYVATRLIAAGVDVRTVAGRLGHANPAMTLNVYSSWLPEKDREAADVLRGLRGGGGDAE